MINEIDKNGRSKIISHKTGSQAQVSKSISNHASMSAPSHNVNPRPIADAFEEGVRHEATESSNFERKEDQYQKTKSLPKASDQYQNTAKVTGDKSNTKI